LSAISCSASTACTAVGSTRPKFGQEGKVALAERWAGTEWSTQTTPNPTPRTENELADVSCSSSTKCIAGGTDAYRSKGMLQAWNGTEWKIVNSDLDGRLSALSCGSGTSCMGVGYRGLPGSEMRAWKMTEESAKAWSAPITVPPTPAGASIVLLRDVACASTTYCVAVGYYFDTEYKPLVEKWNGSSWSLQSAPNPSEGSGLNQMLSVSCASATFCAATGQAAGKPVATTWNGTTWSVALLAKPGGAETATLEGVSCISATACSAIGKYVEAGKSRALAEAWNGSTWTQQTIPSSGESGTFLSNITCISSSSCIAVGSSVPKWKNVEEEEERKTLVESWNGSSWAIVPSTNPQPFSLLSAISCSASTACTAVGSTRPKFGQEGKVALAERLE